MTLERVETAIASLRDEVSLLVQGLRQISATQEIHTEILRTIGVAATAPSQTEDALQDLLAKIGASINSQSEVLVAIKDSIKRLPADVDAAIVSRGQRNK